MEGLIAALLGWVDTSNSIIDLRSGLQIFNTTDDGDDAEPSCELVFPNGQSIDFTGDDAAAIMDRAELLATSATALVAQLNVLTAAAQQGANQT